MVYIVTRNMDMQVAYMSGAAARTGSYKESMR